MSWFTPRKQYIIYTTVSTATVIQQATALLRPAILYAGGYNQFDKPLDKYVTMEHNNDLIKVTSYHETY